MQETQYVTNIFVICLGLVDTAVKTAETGYMQRRLVKVFGPLSVLNGHCHDIFA